MVIDWLPWEKETFAQAIKLGRPIILDISASWCHWCHVMDQTTYTHGEVIQIINENFIPVRVDTDERPDINERYNQGGWPTTAFLTPAGELMTGATYLPAEDLISLLGEVKRIFLVTRARLDQVKRQVLPPNLPVDFEEKRIYFIKYRDIFLKKFETLLLENFDDVYGGFGRVGPKFPLPGALEFCLSRFKKAKDSSFKKILEVSLEALAENGLFDHLEGGFFRYATDRQWLEPHFEKRLADNLELMELYLKAATVLGDNRWEKVAFKTWSFIKAWLYDPDSNFFYSSVAADENYYRSASRSERFSYRQEKKRPAVDRNLYVNLNGQALATLLEVFQFKNWPWTQELGSLARGGLDRLGPEFKAKSDLFYHFKRGSQGFLPELLADQLMVLKARLAEGSASSFTLARSLWAKVKADFYDKEDGGFYDRRPTAESPLGELSALKILDQNVLALKISKKLDGVSVAKKLLIEVFWPKRSINFGSAPLALWLLEESNF